MILNVPGRGRLETHISHPYSREDSNLYRNGEGWCHGAQDDGFGRSKECEEPGASRERFAADQVPWTDREAMGTKDGVNGIRADEQ